MPFPKRNILRKLAMATAIAACATTVAAQAHGIWFAQRARQIALIYGIGSDDLDMVKRLPLLNTMTAWDADWKPVAAVLRPAGAIPVVDAPAPYAALAASMDYGMWTKRADGEFVNKGKDEVPGAVFSERTFKYAVFLAGPTNREMPLLAGHRLQIVPVGAIPQESGKTASFKVFFDGKPFAGVGILTDFVNDPDMPPMMTGPDGTVSFRLRNQGLNVIAATIVAKSDQPAKYDTIEYRATLSFILPHAEE